MQTAEALGLNRNALFQFLRGLLQPDRIFDRKPILRTVLYQSLFILVLAAIALALTRLIYPDPSVPPPPGTLALNNPSPLVRILFPAQFLLYVGFASITRWLAIRIFGELNRDILDVTLVTIVGAMPLFLMATVIGLLNNLLPFALHAGSGGTVAARMFLALFLLAAAFLWEGRICAAGFRGLFGQNRGRAILTWLTPLIAIVILVSPLLFVMNLARVGP